ncbi:hypothetical protein C6P40_001715 [Pichia californica]|uniref:FHA domain-containing protein n=1 Tax=Pichia californica TaxID=460514 RepID=A0A9P7BDC3_9ASCO|nr:hypothetical protein C6P40_001715 [[Candida] californica]
MSAISNFPIPYWINIYNCSMEGEPPTNNTLRIGRASSSKNYFRRAGDRKNIFLENPVVSATHIEIYKTPNLDSLALLNKSKNGFFLIDEFTKKVTFVNDKKKCAHLKNGGIIGLCFSKKFLKDFQSNQINKNIIIDETLKQCKILIQIYTNYDYDLIANVFDYSHYFNNRKDQFDNLLELIYNGTFIDTCDYLSNAIYNISRTLMKEQNDLNISDNDDFYGEKIYYSEDEDDDNEEEDDDSDKYDYDYENNHSFDTFLSKADYRLFLDSESSDNNPEEYNSHSDDSTSKSDNEADEVSDKSENDEDENVYDFKIKNTANVSNAFNKYANGEDDNVLNDDKTKEKNKTESCNTNSDRTNYDFKVNHGAILSHSSIEESDIDSEEESPKIDILKADFVCDCRKEGLKVNKESIKPVEQEEEEQEDEEQEEEEQEDEEQEEEEQEDEEQEEEEQEDEEQEEEEQEDEEQEEEEQEDEEQEEEEQEDEEQEEEEQEDEEQEKEEQEEEEQEKEEQEKEEQEKEENEEDKISKPIKDDLVLVRSLKRSHDEISDVSQSIKTQLEHLTERCDFQSKCIEDLNQEIRDLKRSKSATKAALLGAASGAVATITALYQIGSKLDL